MRNPNGPSIEEVETWHEAQNDVTSGILWVTHGKDREWFESSAKSYAKFATGFKKALVVVPTQDFEAFNQLADTYGIDCIGQAEWADKPFLWHMYMKMQADMLMPGIDRVFHMDADSVFAQPVTPDDWFVGDKILLPYTLYDAFLKREIKEGEMEAFQGCNGLKVDFSLGQYNWRFAVEFALGHRVERECMAWQPIVHDARVYRMSRMLLDERWPGGWDGYIRSGRNSHPQQFCEFNTLGAVAHKYFDNLYEWWNLEGRAYPFYGKVIQSWSHGGMDKVCDYGQQVSDKTVDTPRKLFEQLGLL